MHHTNRLACAALAALCLLLALPAMAAEAPQFVWNASGAPLNLQIEPQWPGMHGAMDPFEAALKRDGPAPQGWTAVSLITPAGDTFPALAPSGGLAAWQPGDASRVAVVNNPDPGDRLNLRRLPDTKSASKGKYYNGAVVTVLARRDDGWAQVSIRGYRGWMRAQYLRFDALPEAKASAIPTGYVKAVKGGVLQLQLNPYYGHNVGKYEAGTPARILGVTGGWAHVYMPNGQAGFIEIKNLDVPGGLRP